MPPRGDDRGGGGTHRSRHAEAARKAHEVGRKLSAIFLDGICAWMSDDPKDREGVDLEPLIQGAIILCDTLFDLGREWPAATLGDLLSRWCLPYPEVEARVRELEARGHRVERAARLRARHRRAEAAAREFLR